MRPRRRRTLLGAGVALAVLLVALLAAAGVFSGGGTESETDGGEPTATAELTTDDAAERAQDYLRAFGSGDVRALRGMLDPNVVLKEADATTDGSDAVVANHQQTLSRLGGKQLEFSWDVENTDANEGKFSASGPYVLFADGVPEQRGEIGVRLEQTGSRLLITEICLDCPELTTKGDYPPR